MASPIGEEFILVKPSLAGFRAELTAQLSAALSGIQPQLAAAQNRLRTGAAGTATAAGLPAVTAATATLGKTTTATTAAVTKLNTTNKETVGQFQNLGRNIRQAETAAGRYTRGVVAATAASTGFFRAVSFASGAFLVGAAVGATIGAAVNEFKQMTIVGAQTAAILKATGGAANVTAAQVDALAKTQLRLTGTDDELVKSAANVLLTFRSIRNEVGAGNDIFTRSVKAVQDISSVFGTALTGSAVQLGKALQDPIRGVTALRRSGITLSQSQRDLIKALVESGRILTAQKIILGEVERQVGGTAAAIGKTLPGQLSILREEAKNSLGEFVKRISESRDAAATFKDVTGGIGDAFKVVGPPLKAAAEALGLIVKSAQGLGVLRPFVKVVTLLAVAFGSLKLALATVNALQAVYARVTVTTVAATTEEAAAVAALTAAQAASAGATTAAAAAQGRAAAATATSATRLSGFGIAARALGGPLGIAAIAVTGFGLAIKKMIDLAKTAPGSLAALRTALKPFQTSVGRVGDLRSQVAAASENVSLARFDAQAAARTTARARAAASAADPGSVTAQFRANQLAVAVTKQKEADDALTAAQQKQARIQRELTAAQLAQPFVIGNVTKSINDQVTAIERGIKIRAGSSIFQGTEGVTAPHEDQPTQKTIEQAFRTTTQRLTALQNSGNAAARAVASPLLAVIGAFNRLPTKKEFALVLKLVGLGKDQQAILSQLGIIAPVAGERGQIGTHEPVLAVNVAAQENANLREQFRALTAIIAAERTKLKTLNDIVAKRKQELATIKATVAADKEAVLNAQDALTSARQSLDSARRSYSDAVTTLRDTIIQSNQAIAQAVIDARNNVTNAVQQAKSNLESLGQTIAGILNQLRQAGGGAATGKLGPEFRRLRDQILAGGGGPETARIAQRLSSQLAAKQPPTADVTQAFNDLTDKRARGELTGPQFATQLRALLKGVTPAEIARILGSSVANTFKDAVRAIIGQSSAIPTGLRRGGATAFDIVRPLNAVASGARAIAAARNQATKDIGSATRAVGDAVNGIKRSEHDVIRAEQGLTRAIQRLHADQVKETKANTAAQRANTRALNRHSDLLAAIAKRDKTQQSKPKPKGNAATTAGDIVNQGAVAP